MSRPLPELAARYSLTVPLAAVGTAAVLCEAGQIVFHERDAIVGTRSLVLCVFWVAISSLVTGIASLFGIRRGRVAPILWRSGIGIVASLIIGLCALYWLAWDGYGHREITVMPNNQMHRTATPRCGFGCVGLIGRWIRSQSPLPVAVGDLGR